MTDIKAEENGSLHKVYLRERFSELGETLENKVSSVISQELDIWGSENLPVHNLILFPSSSAGRLKACDSLSGRRPKAEGVPYREFSSKPSLLTELLSISHIQSIYNIFVATLLIMFLSKTAEQIFILGEFHLDMSLTIWSFGKIEKVFMIWLCMKISTTVLIYSSFHHWAYHRIKSPGIYDVIGSLLLITYLILLLYLPTKYLLLYDLPPASSFIVLCEQVRFFMKTWAFVRSNMNRAVNFKKDDSSSFDSPCPDFSHYLYFLFSPTLIYRDEYPRNKHCNWGKVVRDLLQVIGCIIYSHFLFANYCIPVLNSFGKEKYPVEKLLMLMFSLCFPGALLLLCGFFALLHSWMNAFAEMLRFSDRTFYRDWWNSTSYARFYRTWNCVVHDWLYEYIYKEFTDLQIKYGGCLAYMKPLPVLLVFFISAIVHEYILSFAFKFFYPVLLVCFGGFGVLFMFINTRAKLFNIFVWMSLILGTGLMILLYFIEWYARINCPPIRDDFLDYVIPRSWFCTNEFPSESFSLEQVSFYTDSYNLN